MRLCVKISVTLVLVALFIGDGGTSLRAGEVIDLAGRRVVVPEQPQRVIALAPSIAEMVFSLGRGSVLKGVTQFSDYPEQVKSLPQVGSYVQPDLERIIALQPDLCIATKDGNPKHVVERIEAAGIPVFVIDPRNLSEIIEVISRLGDILNAQEQAALIARDMRERIQRVREKVVTITTRPGVFFQIDAAPIVSAGHNTFVNELISLAGGINLADGPDAYPRFSWEELLVLAPEVVIITTMAGGYPEEHLVGQWLQWHQIPAVRDHRVHVVDAGLFDRPTARLIDGLEILATLIHPDLFAGKRGHGSVSPEKNHRQNK